MSQPNLQRTEELKDIVRKSIFEAILFIEEISESLLACSRILRSEHYSAVFNTLSQELSNLHGLFEYVCALRESIETLKRNSITLDGAVLQPFERVREKVVDSRDAFERKDWIRLADIIDVDICPTLEEGRMGLDKLKEMLG